MRYSLASVALFLTLMFAFPSCKKTYYCHCDRKTVVDNDTVKSVLDIYSIRDLEEDAKAECRYYETEETYLNRYAIVYHYCELKDDDKPEVEVVEE